jgi:nucleoside-diphosphate-sugar epimerase
VSSLLVIGGSGFFGKSILDAYRRGNLAKWQITKIYIFSRNATSLEVTNPELLCESVSLINGDIATCDSLPIADYIVHAAASSDALKYIEAPEIERKNILSGTINFCNLMRSKEAAASKIIYVSSGAVYGRSTQSKTKFCEEEEFSTLNVIAENKRHYSAAKRDSEKKIIELGNSGSRVAIARCFAFIGKYLPRDQHFAIGNFIQDGLDRRPINVDAQKKVYRSYMYADDLVEWLMTIAENAKEDCPIFNVGSDEVIEIRDLAKLVGDFYNVDVKTKQWTEERQDFYIPSVDKARQELGLKINYFIKDAIKINNLAIKEDLKIKNRSNIIK